VVIVGVVIDTLVGDLKASLYVGLCERYQVALCKQ
jgi:hypothetical protein